MTREEVSHLLCSASKSAEAAAHLILVSDHNPLELRSLVESAQSALGFAVNCGGLNEGMKVPYVEYPPSSSVPTLDEIRAGLNPLSATAR